VIRGSKFRVFNYLAPQISGKKNNCHKDTPPCQVVVGDGCNALLTRSLISISNKYFTGFIY
jgi:hypothetical protein